MRKNRKIAIETLDSRQLLTSLVGDAVDYTYDSVGNRLAGTGGSSASYHYADPSCSGCGYGPYLVGPVSATAQDDIFITETAGELNVRLNAAAADRILTLTGYGIVLGGHEGDTITASLISQAHQAANDGFFDVWTNGS